MPFRVTFYFNVTFHSMLPSITDRPTDRVATVTRGEIAIQTVADTYGVDRKVSKIDTETDTNTL